MADLWGWVEDQREKNSRAFYRLLEQGRSTWTPRDILNRCCVKWLVDGGARYDEYGGFYDEYSPRNGCSGCSRDHPCITLRFNANTNMTIASMSHRLDPFVRCLNGLVSEEKAWPHSATEYHLDGYLRPNETVLRSHDGFGSHLIKVPKGEREASDAAQAAEAEEREDCSRAAKRRRGGEDASISALNANDFATAMHVVAKQWLQIELQNDPFALLCLRQVCKSFKKIATSIASTKVNMLDLSITPLVNGRQKYGDSKLDGYDSETFDDGGFGPEGPDYVAEYEKRDKISFVCHHPMKTGGGRYQPVDTTSSFGWKSGLERDAEEEDADSYDTDRAKYAYRGQILRVYWHPGESDPVRTPTRMEGMYGEAKPRLGVRIAEFHLHEQPSCGSVSTSEGGVSVRYEVLQSTTSKTEEVDREEEVSDYETDEEAEDGVRRIVDVVEHKTKYVEYSGRIKLLELRIDFGVLVRFHARHIRSELQRKYGNIMRERPLTQSEKEYQEMVIAATGLSIPAGYRF